MDGSKQSLFDDEDEPALAPLVFDGERFIPAGVESEIDLEHYHRYFAAADMVRGLRVLDMASGAGYGAAVLAKQAAEVVGLDVDPAAVAHARGAYAASNLSFVTGDCASPPFPDASFDAIVSFETIEHITAQESFLDACKRLLKPGGMLIISTPERTRYNAQLGAPNPHHKKELSERQFRAALRARFQKVKVSGQRVMFGSLIAPNGSVPKLSVLNRRKGALETGSAFASSIYLIAVCSDETKPAFPAGVYEGALPQNTVSSLVGGIRERDEQVSQLRKELAEARAAGAARPDMQKDGAADPSAADRDLIRELAAHTSILASMRARTEWAGEELERAREDGRRTALELAGAQTRLADQEARLQQANGARENLAVQLDDKTASIARLEADLKIQAEAMASVVRELSGYRKQVADGVTEREGLIRDVERVKKDFRFDQERYEKMIARAASAEAWLDSERRRVGTLESKIADLEARLVTQRQFVIDADLAAQARGGAPASLPLPPVAEKPVAKTAAKASIKAAAKPSAAVAPAAAATPVAQPPSPVAPPPQTDFVVAAPTAPAAHAEVKIAKQRRPIMSTPLDLVTFARRYALRNPRQAIRLTRDAYLLRKLGAVDAQDYSARYPDIGGKAIDPVRHYLLHGANEGRDPGPEFSTSGYLAANPDVRTSGLNPLVHYVRFGQREGRVFGRGNDGDFGMDEGHFQGPGFAQPPAAGTDLYAVRPDDIVGAEIRRGESFLARFKLLEAAGADVAGALAAIPMGYAVSPGSPIVPDVSIIIPVHGQLAYTLNCLHALSHHESGYRFEVIVIDDKSPDNSFEVLSRIPWIRLLRNEQNQGFLKTCNIAAKQAKGRHLVLLNNDTRVVSGWLNEMIDSFTTFPNAGLVGSKLFFSDGKLQEAGGVIWRDGSGWNYGRDDDPGRPEYCYARQVDYVSGAAIAVPADLWRQLDGFDERYAPAYCEDSDLAMRVREAGREVWMQPLSRVLHYEGKTSGTDTTQGVKAYQVRNSQVLYERWKHVLADHGEPGGNVQPEVNRYARKRVLVLDAITPTPAEDAGSVTTTTTLQILQQLGYTPTFIPVDNFLFYPPHTPALQRIGVQCGYVPYDMNFEQHIQRHGAEYDLVLAYRFSVLEKVLPALKRLAPQLPVAFHNIDVHYLRLERQAALTNDAALAKKAQKTKQDELNVIRAVGCTIVHSTTERDLLLKEAPGAEIVVFPYMTGIVGTQASFEARRDVMFLGGYTHQPNEDAVLHFVRDIWPGLKASLPGARFIAVGANPTPAMKSLASEDVIITGQVEDMGPYFDRSRIFVCPLRYGAGVKGKISTSMAHGLPVISTDIGVEGMEMTPGREVVVANGEVDIAAAVRALYADKVRWQAMAAAGLAFVAEHNSIDMGVQKVGEVIRLARKHHAG